MSEFEVIIGQESSGVMREAFRDYGVAAWSCDLQPADDGSPYHLQGDIRYYATAHPWKFGIFHPDCTYLTVSAAWAFKDPDFERYPGVGYHQRVKPGTLTGEARRKARDAALDHVRWIMSLPYSKVIENPGTSFISKAIRKPDQIIQPNQFGDDASKATGLWLDKVDPLQPTEQHPGRLVEWPKGSGRIVRRWANQTDSGQNRLSPDAERWKVRSKTYPGIAAAAATQWRKYATA